MDGSARAPTRRSRLAELGVGLLLNGAALSLNVLLHIHERLVPTIQVVDDSGATVYTARDPALSFPLVKEQLPMAAAIALCLGVPMLVAFVVACTVPVAPGFRSGVAVAWVQGHGICNLLTHSMKCLVGRPRPNYYALLEAGRSSTAHKSFPSGHSSTAAASMCMLALLLLSVARKHRRLQAPSAARYVVRFAAVAMPAMFAVWVGVTRLQDYFHHYDDVVGGFVIGIVAGTIAHFNERVDNLVIGHTAMHMSSGATGLEAMLRRSVAMHPSSGSDGLAPNGQGAGRGLHVSAPSTPSHEGDDVFQTWPTPKPAGLGAGDDARAAFEADGPSTLHFRSARSNASQSSVLSYGI